MIEQDTVKLLRECDAGAKMGVDSFDDVLGHVQSDQLKTLLTDSRNEHKSLSEATREMLNRYGDEGKDPPAMAAAMSEMKTGMKLAMHGSDKTIADLMIDGCNMGVKSLSRYLNQYKAADEPSKDIAKKLIHAEAQLAADLRAFL